MGQKGQCKEQCGSMRNIKARKRHIMARYRDSNAGRETVRSTKDRMARTRNSSVRNS